MWKPEKFSDLAREMAWRLSRLAWAAITILVLKVISGPPNPIWPQYHALFIKALLINLKTWDYGIFQKRCYRMGKDND